MRRGFKELTLKLAAAICAVAALLHVVAPGAVSSSALATVALPSATVIAIIVVEALMTLLSPSAAAVAKEEAGAASAAAQLDQSGGAPGVKFLYASETGTSKKFAEQAVQRMVEGGVAATCSDLLAYDPLDLKDERGLVVFILSTWTGGLPPAAAKPFFDWITDATHDFRSPKSLLVTLHCAVFGLGNSEYADAGNHAKAGRDLLELLTGIGAHAVCALGVGDDMEDQDAHFGAWLADGPMRHVNAATGGGASDAAKEAAGRKRNGRPRSEVSRWDGKKKKPLRQYRREKREAREKAEAAERHAVRQAARAAKAADAAPGAAETTPVAEGDASDDEEEDRINARLIEEEERAFAATEAKRAAAAAIGAAATKRTESGVVGAVGADAESDEEESEAKQAHGARGAAGGGGGGDEVADLEDLAFGLVVASTATKRKEPSAVVKEALGMVTPKQDRALKKEGYHIIGTHSAVKLCRWTKNQLRGRGGCYKHTCYGITSYQCMEATPSLACANKCVLFFILNTHFVCESCS